MLFTGGGNDKPKTVVTKKTLVSFADTDAEVSLGIDGPINANSLHEQVRIEVNNNDATLNIIRGYDGDVVKTRSFANTENAYSAFLSALSTAGFTRGDKDEKLKSEAGACPLGMRYTFQFKDGTGKVLSRYWSTSCGGTKTYLGNTNLTITLFQAQIPDYSELVSDTSL
ncbi:MAG: hypothetical protein AAB436_00860 [Patescibacteria group bacterium]